MWSRSAWFKRYRDVKDALELPVFVLAIVLAIAAAVRELLGWAWQSQMLLGVGVTLMVAVLLPKFLQTPLMAEIAAFLHLKRGTETEAPTIQGTSALSLIADDDSVPERLARIESSVASLVPATSLNDIKNNLQVSLDTLNITGLGLGADDIHWSTVKFTVTSFLDIELPIDSTSGRITGIGSYASVNAAVHFMDFPSRIAAKGDTTFTGHVNFTEPQLRRIQPIREAGGAATGTISILVRNLGRLRAVGLQQGGQKATMQ